MKLLHVRHATSIITYAGYKILIDPVLSEKEAYPEIPLTPNRRKNPLTNLSTPLETILDVDFILSTHLHNDHFDRKAKELIPKEIPIICQSEDEQKLQEDGFLKLFPIKDSITYQNITIHRVKAQHGVGGMCKAMGTTSGYILQAANEPTIYLTGDTVYNKSVELNILKYKPDVMLMNAGSPKFLYSDRIVMNIIDIEKTLKVNPKLTFILVHLNTFNHCIETREDLQEYFTNDKLLELGVKSFYVPKDNELLEESCF